MKVEVRVELFSKSWKKIIDLWKEEPSRIQLEGLLGSVTGVFTEKSEDIKNIRNFYSKYKDELSIRYNEIPRVIYTDIERGEFDVHLIFCDVVYDSISLEKNYDTNGSCRHCKNENLPKRKGSLKLYGNEYKNYSIFSTEINEIVVNQNVKDKIESGFLKGVVLSACYSEDGKAINGYYELNTVSDLGTRLTENGESLACPLCGQWEISQNMKFPPWNIYYRKNWDGSDIVFTSDSPPSICGSVKFIELLSQIDRNMSLNCCQPIHWY